MRIATMNFSTFSTFYTLEIKAPHSSPREREGKGGPRGGGGGRGSDSFNEKQVKAAFNWPQGAAQHFEHRAGAPSAVHSAQCTKCNQCTKCTTPSSFKWSSSSSEGQEISQRSGGECVVCDCVLCYCVLCYCVLCYLRLFYFFYKQAKLGACDNFGFFYTHAELGTCGYFFFYTQAELDTCGYFSFFFIYMQSWAVAIDLAFNIGRARHLRLFRFLYY